MNISESDKKRFWDKVDKSGDCWEWTAGTRREYGRFRLNGKMPQAHRVAYSLVKGVIPEGMHICHHCDNPSCVRFSHLFMGTRSDNQQDSIAKGRKNPPKGETNGMSKLCENDVHEIRRLHSLGFRQNLIAKMWKVSIGNINFIVHKESWKHIADLVSTNPAHRIRPVFLQLPEQREFKF